MSYTRHENEIIIVCCPRQDLNPQPTVYKLTLYHWATKNLGEAGLEPALTTSKIAALPLGYSPKYNYWGREDLNLQSFTHRFTVYRDNRSATSSNNICFWLESNHITTFAELHSCHLNYRRKIRVAGLEPQSSIPKTDALTYYATPCIFLYAPWRNRTFICKVTALYFTIKLTVLIKVNRARGIRTPAGNPNSLANYRVNHSAIARFEGSRTRTHLMILETIVLPLNYTPISTFFKKKNQIFLK